MGEYDVIIQGGNIVDGVRTPRYSSDLAIKGGKIAKIGGLRGSSAAKVLDARGLIVAPGFVDLHTHYDAQIQWDPYCTLSGWHGVTSVAMGNCGFGFAPCQLQERDRAMLTMTRNEAIPYNAMKAGMLWDWVTFPEFMDTLERIPKGVNALTYVPLTPLYIWVMGIDAAKSRRPTDAELKEMCRVLNEGIDAGACGWSAQVLGPDSPQRDYDGTPMVTDLMTDEELFTFAQVLGERDEGHIQISYYEAPDPSQTMRESTKLFFEKLAGISGRPVIYQQVQPLASDAEKHRHRIRWLEDCTRRGLRIYGQGATTRAGRELTFEDWNLFDMSPAWREVTLGTPTERKGKMQNQDNRRRLREEWDAGDRPGANLVASVEGLMVAVVANRDLEKYQGLRVREIAYREGKHVIDALLDIVVADDLRTEFWVRRDRHNPQFTAEVINSPYVTAGVSDGGAHVKFSSDGNYPTDLLIWMVRDEGLVSLEEAHYTLSYLPAFFGGFRDRGFLREGAPADIVVYDLDRLELGPVEVAHDFPGGEWRRVQREKGGYRWILVNGQITFENGQATGALPGRFLRHGRG